ncbi:MAG: DUF3048 domain-containing protein [Actinomycetota bacterium]|nr:DUF3048 domain-containing protein [Actinomycetota bacterium]
MRKTILGCLLTITLAACGGGGTPAAKKTGPPPPPRSSLTGLVVADPSVLKRPVLAIKVENSEAARPQSGLDAADIVYEELAEGGITRFIALFESQDAPKVGPVRSARLVDPDILLEYNAMLAYSGAHHIVQAALIKSGIVLLSHGKVGSPTYYRSAKRYAPHNLYTSTAGLYKAAGDKGEPPPADLFQFSEQPPVLPSPQPSGATPTPKPRPSSVSIGTSIRIPFSGNQTSIWKYDAAKDSYMRWQGSSRHKLEDGSQVAARNVLLLFVRIGTTAIVDAAGHNSPDVEVIGHGKVVLYRNGLKVEGTWTRSSKSGRTKLLDLAGKPIVLAPGQTWVELVPNDVEVTTAQ